MDELLEEIEKKQTELEQLEKVINTPKKITNIKPAQVFKATCSKYFFRKVQGIPGSRRQLFDNTGSLVCTDSGILVLCSDYYQKLFTRGDSPSG